LFGDLVDLRGEPQDFERACPGCLRLGQLVGIEPGEGALCDRPQHALLVGLDIIKRAPKQFAGRGVRIGAMALAPRA
jgi:hypothetical protein